ncbi:MAG: hypothetical protein COB66_06435 [Coxiella sp. (in: Bacteria)]|nr:MAG: hypothetical protein COB66_06435 [Coxiella sp. (in: g-proteobacteria)]
MRRGTAKKEFKLEQAQKELTAVIIRMLSTDESIRLKAAESIAGELSKANKTKPGLDFHAAINVSLDKKLYGDQVSDGAFLLSRLMGFGAHEVLAVIFNGKQTRLPALIQQPSHTARSAPLWELYFHYLRTFSSAPVPAEGREPREQALFDKHTASLGVLGIIRSNVYVSSAGKKYPNVHNHYVTAWQNPELRRALLEACVGAFQNHVTGIPEAQIQAVLTFFEGIYSGIPSAGVSNMELLAGLGGASPHGDYHKRSTDTVTVAPLQTLYENIVWAHQHNDPSLAAYQWLLARVSGMDERLDPALAAQSKTAVKTQWADIAFQAAMNKFLTDKFKLEFGDMITSKDLSRMDFWRDLFKTIPTESLNVEVFTAPLFGETDFKKVLPAEDVSAEGFDDGGIYENVASFELFSSWTAYYCAVASGSTSQYDWEKIDAEFLVGLIGLGAPIGRPQEANVIDSLVLAIEAAPSNEECERLQDVVIGIFVALKTHTQASHICDVLRVHHLRPIFARACKQENYAAMAKMLGVYPRLLTDDMNEQQRVWVLANLHDYRKASREIVVYWKKDNVKWSRFQQSVTAMIAVAAGELSTPEEKQQGEVAVAAIIATSRLSVDPVSTQEIDRWMTSVTRIVPTALDAYFARERDTNTRPASHIEAEKRVDRVRAEQEARGVRAAVYETGWGDAAEWSPPGDIERLDQLLHDKVKNWIEVVALLTHIQVPINVEAVRAQLTKAGYESTPQRDVINDVLAKYGSAAEEATSLRGSFKRAKDQVRAPAVSELDHAVLSDPSGVYWGKLDDTQALQAALLLVAPGGYAVAVTEEGHMMLHVHIGDGRVRQVNLTGRNYQQKLSVSELGESSRSCLGSAVDTSITTWERFVAVNKQEGVLIAPIRNPAEVAQDSRAVADIIYAEVDLPALPGYVKLDGYIGNAVTREYAQKKLAGQPGGTYVFGESDGALTLYYVAPDAWATCAGQMQQVIFSTGFSQIIAAGLDGGATKPSEEPIRDLEGFLAHNMATNVLTKSPELIYANIDHGAQQEAVAAPAPLLPPKRKGPPPPPRADVTAHTRLPGDIGDAVTKEQASELLAGKPNGTYVFGQGAAGALELYFVIKDGDEAGKISGVRCGEHGRSVSMKILEVPSPDVMLGTDMDDLVAFIRGMDMLKAPYVEATYDMPLASSPGGSRQALMPPRVVRFKEPAPTESQTQTGYTSA